MLKNISIVGLILVGGGILSTIVPRGVPFRLMTQLLVVSCFILLAYYVTSSIGQRNTGSNGPMGFINGLLLAAASASVIAGFVASFGNAGYSANHLSYALLFHALSISLCASTFEELGFRGSLLVILGQLPLRRRGLAIVIIVQAALFTALHYNHFRLPVFYFSTFTIGVAFGIITVRQRSLWMVIGMHAGLDFISAIVSGVHFGHAADYPGILSFDAHGNELKIDASLVFPVFLLSYIVWRRHRVCLGSQRRLKDAPHCDRTRD